MAEVNVHADKKLQVCFLSFFPHGGWIHTSEYEVSHGLYRYKCFWSFKQCVIQHFTSAIILGNELVKSVLRTAPTVIIINCRPKYGFESSGILHIQALCMY